MEMKEFQPNNRNNNQPKGRRVERGTGYTPLDKKEYPEVYHATMTLVSKYSFITSNTPNTIQQIVNKGHAEIYDALISIFFASNTYDYKEKLNYLIDAQSHLYRLYINVHYLLNSKKISPGQIGEIADCMENVNTQVSKWLSSVRKEVKRLETKVDSITP